VYHPYYDENGNEFEVEVPLKYALIIGLGIQHSRKMEIEAISKDAEGLSLFSERKNVEAKINRILQSKILNPSNLRLNELFGQSPESYLKEIGCDQLPGETLAEKSKNMVSLAHLGRHADQYHVRIRWFAHFFSTAPEGKIFCAADLRSAAREFAELEQNMSSSKVHSYCLKK
jgi:hypothetical protein